MARFHVGRGESTNKVIQFNLKMNNIDSIKLFTIRDRVLDYNIIINKTQI